MSLPTGNDRTAVHRSFQSNSGRVCQPNISDFDQVISIDIIQRANNMNMARDFWQGLAHNRPHGFFLWNKFLTGMNTYYQLKIGSLCKKLKGLRDPLRHRNGKNVTSKSEAVAKDNRS